MIILIEVSFGIIVLLLLLFSVADIRFCYYDFPSISISFIFTKLTFNFEKKRQRRGGVTIPFYSALFREILATIKYTSVQMAEPDYSYIGSSPIRALLPPILIPLFVAILKVNSKEFDLSDSDGAVIDIRFKIHLYRLFIFASKILYYYVKYRKRGRANA